MAIDNRVALGGGRYWVNFSVSFVSQAGDQASYRTVPDGKLWELLSLRATHEEAGPVGMNFMITDGATDLAVLTEAPGRIQGETTIGWTGSLFVPAGWRVYAQYWGMTGGATSNWQYIAIERDN